MINNDNWKGHHGSFQKACVLKCARKILDFLFLKLSRICPISQLFKTHVVPKETVSCYDYQWPITTDKLGYKLNHADGYFFPWTNLTNST